MFNRFKDFANDLRTSFYSFSKEVKFEGKGFFAHYYRYIKRSLYTLHSKAKDLKKTNYDLAVYHYKKGNLNDAIFRFKLIDRFNVDRPEIHYYIGRCYIEKAEYEIAQKYFEKYIRSSNNSYREEAIYCLNVARLNEAKITKVPSSIIARYFDVLCDSYNDIFYSADESPAHLLVQAINEYNSTSDNKKFSNVLDLGCGTGKAGLFLRMLSLGKSVVGVDISYNMVNASSSLKYNGSPVYDDVHYGNFLMYLNDLKGDGYDLVIASESLMYDSDIGSYFDKIKRILKKSGILALTVKIDAKFEGDFYFDVYLENFVYSPQYLVNEIEKNSLKVIESIDINFPNSDTGRIILLNNE